MGVRGIEYGHEHERLEHLLRSVDRPGEYCVGGRLFTPLPRVVVDGAGELSFPIPRAQIRSLIAAAERAPCGKGTETVVDRTVRDCWQIDAEQVRLTGRAWPHSFRKVMDLVAAGLGLPAERLGADLHNPVQREERFKVRKDLRKHLHRVIDRHRLDMHHVTERTGRPYTLVCTKNRAGHERRLEEYAEDLRRMSSLLTSIPEGERRGGGTGRAEMLDEALATGGAGPG
ncbi:MAG: hypothetical protein OXU64_03890 [Gemmatimonadota bacterium]|nr:hypothetical protein [Gemmatimonadota bacterium]